MVKEDGEWKETDWQTALNITVDGLRKVKETQGDDSLAAISSPNATTEELYLLQKLLRDLGSNNIDTRLRRIDFSEQNHDPLYPSLGIELADLKNLDATLLVGSNLRKEQPIAAVQLRKSAEKGPVMEINPHNFQHNFATKVAITVASDEMLANLGAVAKALAGLEGVNAADGINDLSVEVSKDHKRIAKKLLKGEKAAILFGQFACNHADFSKLAALANAIAEMSGATFGTFSDGANAAGAHIAGAIPHRGAAAAEVETGKNISQMFSGDIKAFVLQDVEPDLDCTSATRKALDDAHLVIALTPYNDGAVSEYADIMLPTAAFSETSGTFVNVAGTWQSFKAAVAAKGEARPGWKILRVLGNLLDLSGYDYVSSEEVRDELQLSVDSVTPRTGDWPMIKSLDGATDMANVRSIYQVDPLVRRAKALQATLDGRKGTLAGEQS